MNYSVLYLKKGEERRIKQGHVWVYSNEVDTKRSSLKDFQPGQEVMIKSANQEVLGMAYVNPHSLIAARLFSRQEGESLSAALLARRFQQALDLRQSLFEKPYYRLAFGESDALPGLVVDRFNEHLVLQCNTYGMENKKTEIIEALKQILPQTQSMLWRNDSSIRSQEGLESEVTAAWGTPPEQVLVEENGTLFQFPLWQGQKTGWFYDHRMNRARLQAYVPGKRVLDVFSYMGGWGIQAARFGAKQVQCIDSSALACEWIEKNAVLNQLQDKVSAICEQAVPALQALYKEKQKFDVIVLDPPAFIKKRKDQKEGMLAYQRINALALKLLEPSGILVSGSCSMHLSYEDLIQVLQTASHQMQAPLQILERGHQGPDHPVHVAIPETDYLKAIFLRRLEY